MKAVAEVKWELHLDPDEQWRDVKANVEFVVDKVASAAGMPNHVEVSGFLVKSDGSMGKARRSNTVQVDDNSIPDDGVQIEIDRLRAAAQTAVRTMSRETT